MYGILTRSVMIEMFQRRAARFVYQDYYRFSHKLGWDSLEHRRLVNQVGMFYKIYKGHAGISLPVEIQSPLSSHPWEIAN